MIKDICSYFPNECRVQFHHVGDAIKRYKDRKTVKTLPEIEKEIESEPLQTDGETIKCSVQNPLRKERSDLSKDKDNDKEKEKEKKDKDEKEKEKASDDRKDKKSQNKNDELGNSKPVSTPVVLPSSSNSSIPIILRPSPSASRTIVNDKLNMAPPPPPPTILIKPLTNPSQPMPFNEVIVLEDEDEDSEACEWLPPRGNVFDQPDPI
eukprot:TRINITY_DN10015_c0_g1_i2.p1 TRINITY_DN10015_c0_g1~~TRINITY_DN10015_c0_g1_i2.p1  ORF type:complete len:208 (-),score=57.41 TRINITY_DN10015_c0_g1_i2:562-1185(-)